MTALPELLARLTELSIAWSIERNEHRLVYEPAAYYLENHPLGYDEDDISPADRQRCAELDEIYEVRAYPTTPVGFVEFAGPDLEETVRRLVEALEPAPTTDAPGEGAR